MSKMVLLLVFTLFISCAHKKAGWESESAAVTISSESKEALKALAMKEWAKRDDKESLLKAIENFKQLAAGNPGDYQTLVYLCRANYLLADGHLEDKEAKKAAFLEASDWGEKAMATNPAFKAKVVTEKLDVEEALNTLDKKSIEAIYWSAASLGKWAKLTGITTTIKYRSRIVAMVKKVEELDNNYFFGAVNRYWGVYYAVAPSFAGGNLEKSLENFEKSFKTANNYLGGHVLFAENYATKKGDKELFKKELEYVMSTKVDIIPELRAENALEKKKAEKMLKEIDNYF